MADDALARLLRYRTDLAAFSKDCLTVRAKDGTMQPFLLNAAQRFVHDALEAQRREKGWVRAIVLKGRQQGISTYVAARYYRRASLHKGVNVYILAHEQAASDTLFGIVDRYHRNNPLAPHVGTSNIKELEFDRLESSYAVATAGSKAGGRSKAISLFHGSEAAFWSNAGDHFAASVQGVPMEPNTEVILESTSAGAGGEFYERFQDAQNSVGDYIPIFLPWWLSPEYQRQPEPGFTLSGLASEGELSEEDYQHTFGTTLEQMVWRRGKIAELRNPLLFRREYPADPSEAWTAPPGHEPYIDGLAVLRARKRPRTAGAGPLILGVDPASNGGDRFSVAARRGMVVEWVRHRNKIDTLEGTEWVRSLIDAHQPARVNIDAGNIGAAIITNLKAMGPKYALLVKGVDFGATSQAKLAKPKVPGPYNRRAEMWMRCKDWLDMTEGAVLPDEDALQADLTGPKQKPRPDNNFLLESKVDMRARGVRSPDLADSIVLTFASNEFFSEYAEVSVKSSYGNIDAARPQNVYQAPVSGPQGWMS